MNKEKYDFNDLNEIMNILLSENGCPWDKAQTHLSLRQCLIEEAYEVIDAVNRDNKADMCEEIGDVLLQVTLNSKISEKSGFFNIDDVVNGICMKMIRRHSHIFGGVIANTAEEALLNWEREKKEEKKDLSGKAMLKELSSFPALLRSQKILKKIEMEPFNANDMGNYIDKSIAFLNSLKSLTSGDKSVNENDFGRFMLQIGNISNFFQINLELVLTKALETYINNHESIVFTDQSNF